MSMERQESTASSVLLNRRHLIQITAAASLVALSLTPYPSDTQYAPEAPRVTVTDLDLKKLRHDDLKIRHNYRFSEFELRTAFGGINTFSYHHNNGSIGDASALTVISYDPKTKNPQWAKSLRAFQHSTPSRTYSTVYLTDPENQMDSRTSGTLVSSPDGRHVSVLLHVTAFYESNANYPDITVYSRSTHVVVLDARTGDVVRQEKLPDLVLGQALTNNVLAVETAQDFFPGGSGRGKLHVFSLEKRYDPAAEIPVDQWLVGASRTTLLLSSETALQGRVSDFPDTTTVTQLDIHGHVVNTIPNVTEIVFGGWIRTVPTSSNESEHDAEASEKSNLLHVDTGAKVDVSGKLAWISDTPTGTGVFVQDEVPTDDGKTEYVPVFWLSSTDDGHPHTENLEQFKDE